MYKESILGRQNGIPGLIEQMKPEAILSCALVAIVISFTAPGPGVQAADDFDQSYRAYGALLRTHVQDGRVDYTALKSHRAALNEIVDAFGRVPDAELMGWARAEQIAYWVNAYNTFTLRAIVDHYPIEWRWLSLLTLTPRNSIKQIDGVWDELRWQASGAQVTLDEIEHETLRPTFREPRIHFALNCASASCALLRPEPYVGARLDRQLTLAARDFLASDRGLRIEGSVLRVSRIFDWYGDDFVGEYAHLVDGASEKDRAILGVIATYGPSAASLLAQSGEAEIRYLRYDWSLNDLDR